MEVNMAHNIKYRLLLISFCLYSSTALPSHHILNEDEDQAKNIAEIILSNQYLSKESELPKIAVVDQDSDVDTTMLVSKLSDDELISLLKNKQKQDIMEVVDAVDIMKFGKTSKQALKKKYTKKPSQVLSKDSDRGSAFFRIDNKEVEPFNVKVGADPIFLAHQKIKNLLHSAPIQNVIDSSSEETEENKEILFDILTAQLKKLCCKSRKNKRDRVKPPSYEPLLSISNSHEKNQSMDTLQYEQMFLIINDEIKSAQGSDIIYVDPDSLNKNSSAILLGPITTPLSDPQLQVVMTRITSELSKPEYIPLLQELSEGKFNRDNTRLVKSLVFGANTRRFIKPHRCNQRYPQSEGPKWLVCTGYLNINTPSLYD